MRNQNQYWSGVANDKTFTTPFPLKLFQEHVPLNADVLDYGCGYGRILGELSSAGYTSLRGLDFAEGMIQRAQKEHPALKFQLCPPNTIPRADNSVDALVLFAVLTCIPDDSHLDRLLSEIRRVLRPQGILLINDFLLGTDERNQERYHRFADRHPFGTFILPEGTTVRHFASDRLRTLLKHFTTLHWNEQTFTTMNGNETRGVTILARLER